MFNLLKKLNAKTLPLIMRGENRIIDLNKVTSISLEKENERWCLVFNTCKDKIIIKYNNWQSAKDNLEYIYEMMKKNTTEIFQVEEQ